MPRIRSLFVTTCLVGLLSAGCAQVPQESAGLSTLVGQDIAALQVSYDQLIQRYFDSLRAQREAYLQTEWVPKFVGNWVENGRLIDMANSTVIWSDSADDFARPTPGREGAELVYSVQVWAEEAVHQIQTKRAELMSPLDADEVELRADVSKAFANVINANATITALLVSVRKVKETQDEVLGAFDLRETRDAVNDRLIDISNKAQQGLQTIRRADGFVDRAQ